MPKLPFSIVTLVALVLSVAQAQTLPSNATVGVGTYTVDGSSATVGQTITLGIPKRFGLHLDRNTWKLDLTNLKSDGTVTGDNGDANCWRAGDHSSGLDGTGRDVLYDFRNFSDSATIPVTATPAERDAIYTDRFAMLWNSFWYGDQTADSSNPYSYTGILRLPGSRISSNRQASGKRPIGGYPGFYVNPDSSKLEWKGPIMCTFQTIVQKFSNSTAGWSFTGQVADNTAAGKSFPFALYVSDRFDTDNSATVNSIYRNPRPGGLVLRSTDVAKRLARGYDLNANTGVTTGGWLDDNVLEMIVFDGSVAAGDYSGVVTFALADYSLPTQSNGL